MRSRKDKIRRITECATPYNRPSQSPGEGRSGFGVRAWPQQCVCCNRAARVGGIASYALPFCANSCFLASLTFALLLVLSYKRMTNRSRYIIHASLTRGVRCCRQLQEGICDGWVALPYCKSGLLASPSEAGHRIASSECVEHW